MNSTKLKIQEFQNKKNNLITKAEAILRSKGSKDPAYVSALAEIDTIAGDIATLTEISALLPVEERESKPVQPVQAPAVITPAEIVASKRAHANQSMRNYLRTKELRSIDVGSTGAAIVPQEFDAEYTSALKFYGPLATLVKRYDLSSRGTKFPLVDDTAATMSLVNEASSSGSTLANPSSISSVVTDTDTLVSSVAISYNFRDDANVWQSLINDVIGLRASRAIERALTLGTSNDGTNTALPNSPTGGLLGNVTTGATLTTPGTIPYSSLQALKASTDVAYRVGPNSGFMASPSVHDYLALQTDSTGRPLYQYDDEGYLLIGGDRLFTNAAMPAVTASSGPVALYGDYSKAYMYLGERPQIRILQETRADKLELLALIYVRLGAASLVSGAVKSLNA